MESKEVVMLPWRKKVGLPWWLSGKESTCNAGDTGSVPGLGRSPGEGNDNPLQHCYLWNPIVRETWWAMVHRVARGWHNLVTEQQQEEERWHQTGNFRLGMKCHILLRGEEQNLFWDCTCNYVTSHFWYQKLFWKNFHPFSCSYRISDECTWHFRVKA